MRMVFLIFFQAQYKTLGEDVAKVRTEQMTEQLATFKTSLEDFAQKYKVSPRSLSVALLLVLLRKHSVSSECQ